MQTTVVQTLLLGHSNSLITMPDPSNLSKLKGLPHKLHHCLVISLGLTLTLTGSEVQICVEVAKALGASGTRARVVSMPCWELFEVQPEGYQLSGV